MGQFDRILQIIFFHLSRRIVNRLSMPVVVGLSLLVLVLLLFTPKILEWLQALGIKLPIG